MAGGQEQSNKRSRRSKNTRKKRAAAQKSTNGKERTLPKVEPMERVPSNAPTMAIAPSDYEHIFHEGTGANATEAKAALPTLTNGNLPTMTAKPTMPPPPVQLPVLQRSPPPPSPPQALPQPINQRLRSPELDYERHPYAPDVQVTPDGYTLLGHVPDPSARRRVALPAHIVRANNQFSRAALARLAAYLAGRSDTRWSSRCLVNLYWKTFRRHLGPSQMMLLI